MKNSFLPGYLIALSIILSCNTGSNSYKQPNQSAFIASADSLINTTFDTLRKSLQKAINERNTDGAISFCKDSAWRLTNIYTSETVSLKRTSYKYRNPANAPDSMEQRILTAFQQLKDAGKKINPVFEMDKQQRYHYYKPIITQAMCLNCHGNKTENIHPAAGQVLLKNYPSDLAFDYKEGDLRGVWHVILTKTEN